MLALGLVVNVDAVPAHVDLLAGLRDVDTVPADVDVLACLGVGVVFVGVVLLDIVCGSGGCVLGGVRLVLLGIACLVLAVEQLVERHAVETCEGDEVVGVGRGLGALPLRDGLAAHAELGGEGFLREAGLPAEVGEPVCNLCVHDGPLSWGGLWPRC